MKVLVIGSGGYIGGYLAAHLRESGQEIHLSSSRDGSGIDPVTGLLPEGFSVPEGTASVIYLAQSPHAARAPERADHLLAVNVLSAVRAAAVALAAGARRFVYASTGNVYAPSFKPLGENSPLRRDNWYSLSKVQAEEALALFRPRLETISARLFGIYGPGQADRLIPRLVRAVLDGKQITVEPNPTDKDDKDGLRLSLCHVRDAARILGALAEAGGPLQINVASGEVLSIRAIAQGVSGSCGRAPDLTLGAKSRQSDLVADTTVLRQTLAPAFIPFAEGIAEVVDHARASAGGNG